MMKETKCRYKNWEEVQHDLHCLVDHREPVCASTDLTHTSTIVADFSEPAQIEPAQPSFKIKTKKRNEYLSSMQDKHVSQHHEADEKSQRNLTQLLWWAVLVLWFTALFWYRAVLQIDPLRRQELRKRGAEIGSAFEELIPFDHKQTGLEGPDQESAGLTDSLPKSDRQDEINLSPAMLDRIAVALAANDIAAAITAVADDPQNEALTALFRQVPSPEQMVAKHLRKNIDQPLVMNVKGVPRKVTPKAVKGQMVELVANDRSVDLDISSLSIEQKLNWIDKPVTIEEHIAAALLQLQSTEPAKAAQYALGCGALAGAVEKAVQLRK